MHTGRKGSLPVVPLTPPAYREPCASCAGRLYLFILFLFCRFKIISSGGGGGLCLVLFLCARLLYCSTEVCVRGSSFKQFLIEPEELNTVSLVHHFKLRGSVDHRTLEPCMNKTYERI